MALYSIKQETLTDIGDALRRKHGETKTITVTKTEEFTVPTIAKTPNATGFDSFGDSSEVGSDFSVNVTFNGAAYIKIKIGYSNDPIDMFSRTNVSYKDSLGSQITEVFGAGDSGVFEKTIKASSISIYQYNAYSGNYGFYAECYPLDANGEIMDKYVWTYDEEVKRTYKSSEMAQAIDDILPSPPESAFVISGDCQYRFSNNGWNWFIEQYSNKITTKDISNAQFMFNSSDKITKVPFDLNFNSSVRFHNLNSIFKSCSNLTQVPKLNNVIVYDMTSMFSSCRNLRIIPEDIADTWDWSYVKGLTSSYNGNWGQIFGDCYSLRSIPMNLIKSGNPYIYYGYSYFFYGFNDCYALDELINLPIPYTKATWTSNAFHYTFNKCERLKNITFALNNGVPYTVTWKSQVIELTDYLGYAWYESTLLDYNSGITADKEVTDDASYQLLKNDPDWFTIKPEYSRYNHDSAVATINSLPDTSAYLASAGGTNTIKFRGQAGASTDGGAINTLTEEEIAVAAAKGWTVTLV